MQIKAGDVVILVMPGVSVVYLAEVSHDGEGFDAFKERFTAISSGRALHDAQAITRRTGGRVLRWMKDATGPELWPISDLKPQPQSARLR